MNAGETVVEVAIDDLEASNVRRLTPAECDALMGFPKDYTAIGGTETPDSPRYKADGNSWISNEPEWVMSRIEREERKMGNDAQIRYATTCSGVECHSVSVAGRDWHPIFYSEIEPFPCELLKRKYPLVPNLGDMTKIRVERVDCKDWTAQAVVTNGETTVATAREFGSAVVDVFSGGTPCFTKGSYVLTDRGYRPIEDICVGDFVVTHLGNLRKVKRVGHKMSNDIYEVKISSRPKFKVTGNHPFWTGTFVRDWINEKRGWSNLYNVETKWSCIKELNRGSYVATFDFIGMSGLARPSFPTVYKAGDTEIAELIGWYLGDGYIRKWKGKRKKAVILCLNRDKLERFRKRFDGVVNFTVCKCKTATKVQICCTRLADYIMENFGELSHQKRVPFASYLWPEELKTAVVSGYLSTDGHVSHGKTNGIKFTTTSPFLAFGMADFIGKSGVSFSKRPEKCEIEGRVVNQRDTWLVLAYENTRNHHIHERWDFVTLHDIKKAMAEMVYNIEVEDDHSYICNGFCVHNCQDYSIAGKRAGGAEDSGTRSSLAFHFQRIATELNARWICWENVPGAFSVNGGRDFAWFLYRCMEAGYSLAWRVLDGEYVTTERFPRAIAQRRRRIWLVGRRGPHWQKAAQVLFEPLKFVGWNPPDRWIGVGFDERFTDGRPVEHITEDEDTKNVMEAQGDIFGGETGDSPSPRRVLHDADIRICPPKGRLGNVRPVDMEAFARTIGTPLYIGGVFGKGSEPSPESFAEKFLANIGNAGIMADGVVVTMKVPEWNAGLTEEQLETMPQTKRDAYDGTVCGLSDILLETVDAKFDLSWKACWGILRRAHARGKRLKVELEVVLRWRCIKYRNFVEWAMANAKKDSDRANARRCFDEVIAPSWTDDLKPYLIPLDGKSAESASEEEDDEDAEAVLDGDEVAEDAE